MDESIVDGWVEGRVNKLIQTFLHTLVVSFSTLIQTHTFPHVFPDCVGSLEQLEIIVK